MSILIKRYANRKLYNTQASRYITLKGIAKLLDEGEEVRVIDNETGEDITQVALSQILVDNQRAKEDPSDTLLSQILSRGGDALYGAIKRSVDDATEGLGEFQDRFRRIVNQPDPGRRAGSGFPWDARDSRRHEADPLAGDDAGAKELAELVRGAVREALDRVDLPERHHIERLNENLARVARAIERLEEVYRDE